MLDFFLSYSVFSSTGVEVILSLCLVITFEILPCTFNKVWSESVPEPSLLQGSTLDSHQPSLPSPHLCIIITIHCSHPLSSPRIIYHHHLSLVDLRRQCLFAIIYTFANFYELICSQFILAFLNLPSRIIFLLPEVHLLEVVLEKLYSR